MQQQPQQHPVSWADHYPHSTIAAPTASFDLCSPSLKMDHAFRPDWAGVRPSSLAYSPYSQQDHHEQQHSHDGHHHFFQQPTPSARQHQPSSDMAAGGSSSFWNFGSAASAPSSHPHHPHHHLQQQSQHQATIPSPPPSDGSPRPDWALAAAHHHAAAQAAAAAAAASAADHHKSRAQRAGLNFNRNSPVLRPDGVRKKNAKFDIPEERNLEMLDTLIRNATDEGERREFKMQKRLLRNREAALHSRQKKKSYTEQLERENKDLYSRIGDFQHQLTALKIQIDDFAKERATWAEKRAAADERARRASLERESQAKDTLRLVAELNTLRAQLRASRRSPSAASHAVGGGSAGVRGGPGEGNNASAFGTGEWHENNYDFMAELCLDGAPAASKMQGRTDDVRPDVVVR